MSNCSNLCTAAKCAELEARIGALEQALELLEAAFESHTQQEIPQAHGYTPAVVVNTTISGNNVLTTQVSVDSESDYSEVELPSFEPFVTFDIFPIGDNSYHFQVAVNGDSDSDVLNLSDLSNHNTSNLKIDGSYQGDYLTLTIADGESSDTAEILIPIPESEPNSKSNLSIDGIYQGDYLTLTVADGESFDTATIYIKRDEINNYGGGGGSVSCDNLSQEFQECCAQILAAVAINLEKIQQVEQYVTVDVSSTVCSEYECQFPTDDNEQPLLTYAEAQFQEKAFQGKGIAGLNQRLTYLAKNQDAIYRDLCKAIDPITKIYRADLYQFCNDSGISRNDYPDTAEGTEQYTAAVDIYLAELVSQSKYGHLINVAAESENGVLLSAPASYINGILADFALIQGRNNNQALCGISETEPEVVTLIASESDLGRVEGKILILHFVTLNNYPKRQRGSNKRVIRIPAPKEEYNWNADFQGIRWETGNQFAKLNLEGWKPGITGWFKDAAAANACFDQLITLTTATETGRVIPIHTNPRTDIAVKITRPYRAFISREKKPGEGETLFKYQPASDEESN